MNHSCASKFAVQTRVYPSSAYNVQRLGQSAKGNSRPTNFMIGGVGIRGDKTTLKFGNHLSEAEQKFLSQLIRAVLEH